MTYKTKVTRPTIYESTASMYPHHMYVQWSVKPVNRESIIRCGYAFPHVHSRIFNKGWFHRPIISVSLNTYMCVCTYIFPESRIFISKATMLYKMYSNDRTYIRVCYQLTCFSPLRTWFGMRQSYVLFVNYVLEIQIPKFNYWYI